MLACLSFLSIYKLLNFHCNKIITHHKWEFSTQKSVPGMFLISMNIRTCGHFFPSIISADTLPLKKKKKREILRQMCSFKNESCFCQQKPNVFHLSHRLDGNRFLNFSKIRKEVSFSTETPPFTDEDMEPKR